MKKYYISPNTVEFLKNYQKFGRLGRLTVSRALLEKYKATQDVNEKAHFLLAIYDQLMAATEDLAMWYLTLQNRHNFDRRKRDAWEFLLDEDISLDDAATILREVQRYKKGEAFLRKVMQFDDDDFNMLKEYAKSSPLEQSAVLDEFIRVLKSALRNRVVKNGILARLHNKIKHGYAVMFVDNRVLIRDRKKVRKRTVSRKMQIDINLAVPSELVQTIEAISVITSLVVTFVMQDMHRKMNGKNICWDSKSNDLYRPGT